LPTHYYLVEIRALHAPHPPTWLQHISHAPIYIPPRNLIHLFDLINEIINVSLALEGFEGANSRHLSEAVVKPLGVMSELLKLIAEKSRKGVVHVSQIKYLQKVYDKVPAIERKRKRNDQKRNIGDNGVYGLRAMTKKYKTSAKVIEKQIAAPPPIPVYEEPRRSRRRGEGSYTSFDPKGLLDNFTSRRKV
jgi:hypothetical protein